MIDGSGIERKEQPFKRCLRCSPGRRHPCVVLVRWSAARRAIRVGATRRIPRRWRRSSRSCGPQAPALRLNVSERWWCCCGAGLRISEALSLTESDLDPTRGSILVRSGKGGKRREVGMDRWGWEQLRPWLEVRRELPIGMLICVIHGPGAGGPWEATAARKQLRRLALRAGVRRRFAPHQLRHAHAVEMVHEGVPMVIIQRQLGHANLGITSIYLQGIDSAEIINTVNGRRAPVISATAGLAL